MCSMASLFTDRAHVVLKLAEENSQQQNHFYIGTEHLLEALLSETSILRTKLINADAIRRDLAKLAKTGTAETSAALGEFPLPLTPALKRAICLAEEEAKHTGNLISPRELIIGLSRENDGVAAQLLMNQGLNLDQLKQLPNSQD
jgi:ATP-dependent Clp protease ATP-binding subunit ClpC